MSIKFIVISVIFFWVIVERILCFPIPEKYFKGFSLIFRIALRLVMVISLTSIFYIIANNEKGAPEFNGKKLIKYEKLNKEKTQELEKDFNLLKSSNQLYRSNDIDSLELRWYEEYKINGEWLYIKKPIKIKLGKGFEVIWHNYILSNIISEDSIILVENEIEIQRENGYLIEHETQIESLELKTKDNIPFIQNGDIFNYNGDWFKANKDLVFKILEGDEIDYGIRANDKSSIKRIFKIRSKLSFKEILSEATYRINKNKDFERIPENMGFVEHQVKSIRLLQTR